MTKVLAYSDASNSAAGGMSLTLKTQFFKHSGLMKNLRKVLLRGKSKQCCLYGTLIVPSWDNSRFRPFLFEKESFCFSYIADILEFQPGQNIFI